MDPQQNNFTITQQVTSRLLVLTVFLFCLFPFHFHLHHEAPAANSLDEHHVIDLHSSININGQEHHSDSHSIDPASDYKTQTADKLLLAALFISFILITLHLIKRTGRFFEDHRHNTHSPHWQLSAPLRAPPAH